MKYVLMVLLLVSGFAAAQPVNNLPIGAMPGALYFCEQPLVGSTCAFAKPDGTIVTPDPDNGWLLPDAEMLEYTAHQHAVASNKYQQTDDIRDRLSQYYWAVRMIAARNAANPDIATLRTSQRLEGVDVRTILTDLDFTDPEVQANIQATKALTQQLYDRTVRATALAIWLEHSFGLPYD